MCHECAQRPVITQLLSSPGPVTGGQVNGGHARCIAIVSSTYTRAMQTLYIYGRGFGPNGASLDAVSIGGELCNDFAYQSPSIVVCNTPPGVGANLGVLVTVIGQSNSVTGTPTYSYRSPSLSLVRPSTVFTTTAALLEQNFTIQGSDLGIDAITVSAIQIGAALCGDIVFHSSSSIDCLDLDLVAALGGSLPGAGNTSTVDVSVTVANQTGRRSAAILVIGPPVVTSVSPSVIQPGTTIIIRGGVFGFSSSDVASVSVHIGDVACSQISLLDPNSLSVVAPSNSGLNLPVIVTTAGLVSSSVSQAALVSYSVGQAVISAVRPQIGPTRGALGALHSVSCATERYLSVACVQVA